MNPLPEAQAEPYVTPEPSGLYLVGTSLVLLAAFRKLKQHRA